MFRLFTNIKPPILLTLILGGGIGVGSALLDVSAYQAENLAHQAMLVNIRDGVTAEETVILSTYWRNQLQNNVPETAYTQFLERYQNLNNDSQHVVAHIFGEVLYETVGLEGVAICDASFDFGCYHSFFGRAVADKGLDIVTTLDEKCINKHGEQELACQHGIGHGVMDELGDDKLLEALQACKTLQWQGPLGGCMSGVFMEYNSNTMDGWFPRELIQDKKYLPCSNLPDKFLPACYFAQSSWWGRHYEDDFRKLGQWCEDIPHPQFKEYCFKGLGVINVGSDPADVPTLRAECAKMPTQDAVLQCIGGATWSLQDMPDYSESWPAMCDNFRSDEALYTRCLQEKNEM